ncbi:MAG: Nramp family divalent metal transporter [Minisyncoccia bacterium]
MHTFFAPAAGGENHRSIPVPATASFLRKLLAFSGPGYLVAVGYMDPGNWAVDLSGGSAFGYELLTVVLLSSVIAVLLQHLAAKLGLVTGRDLAQLCREWYPKPATLFLWLMAELMVIACDLAEVIGSAIALNLLFGLPILFGIVLTGGDVLLLLFLQNRGYRWLELFVIALIALIAAGFGFELFLSHPALAALFAGFVPHTSIITNPNMLYLSLGIVGATVMPHNLFLHSSTVQTRAFEGDTRGKREAVKFATIDAAVALAIAFFVNAAILTTAAAVFFASGNRNVTDISQAYHLLAPILGTGLAGTVFAVSLLVSGQNSTLTGTLAGQIIMEGFLRLRIAPWLRRVITRLFAIVPALVVVVFFQQWGLGRLLLLSQVILSIELPFVVVPLVLFTGSRKQMGEFVNSWSVSAISGIVAALLIALNLWLIYTSL